MKVFVAINKIFHELFCIKKLNKQNKMKDSYCIDYNNTYLQLKNEIEGVKISESLLKNSLGKKVLVKSIRCYVSFCTLKISLSKWTKR